MSSIGLLSYVADALVSEGRAGTGFGSGCGLYRSEGGTFSCGGRSGKFERYSDTGTLAEPGLGCSSMESSFRTSVTIGALSFSV